MLQNVTWHGLFLAKRTSTGFLSPPVFGKRNTDCAKLCVFWQTPANNDGRLMGWEAPKLAALQARPDKRVEVLAGRCSTRAAWRAQHPEFWAAPKVFQVLHLVAPEFASAEDHPIPFPGLLFPDQVRRLFAFDHCEIMLYRVLLLGPKLIRNKIIIPLGLWLQSSEPGTVFPHHQFVHG